GQLLRIARPFERISLPPNRPFVLYAMQIQPEASLDVMASWYANQVELVRALARGLPLTHDLYVKEHPAALGTRPVRHYRQIASIPGVRLIEPGTNSFCLLEHASAVISVTGTILYEAALLGVP